MSSDKEIDEVALLFDVPRLTAIKLIEMAYEYRQVGHGRWEDNT